MEQLLTRLKKGVAWLTDAQERLLAMERVGRGTELETQFLDAIALWDSLDMALWNIYPEFQGCVLAPNKCLSDAPIRCRGCAG